MQKLIIDKEFQELIPSLSQEERTGLEQNLLANGCLDPLKVWKETNILLDGHNRYEICTRHNIPFDVALLSFDARDAAYKWIINNQLDRRNITEEQRRYLRGKRYASEKKQKEANLKQNTPKDQNDPSDVTHTAAKLAKEYGVSGPTIKRDEKFAMALDVIGEALGKALKDDILNRDLRMTQRDMLEVSKTAKENPTKARSIIQRVKSTKQKAGKILREAKVEEVKQQIVSAKVDGLYDVIAIDPPWDYAEHNGFSPEQHDNKSNRGGVDYPTMSVAELKAMSLPAKDDCVLFLWTTHSFMRDAFSLLDAWGFTHKAIITWDKEKMGIGRTIRLQCEFCLLAVKGKPFLDGGSERDIIREARREHSRKPEEFYAKVERMTAGRKLDYFGREQRNGWDIYGNDANKF